MTMFQFGCGHVKYDPEIHAAKWGARLIYEEIARGAIGSGVSVVWDRQTPDGEEADVRALFDVVDRAIDEFRKVKWELPQDSRGELCWREGDKVVVMSPQGSYGYLYVTAVLEKPDHVGETRLADFSGEIPMDKRFGNWPQEVVDHRAAKAAKRAEEERGYRLQEYVWAVKDIRLGRTERAKTIRQNKALKLYDALIADGYTPTEITTRLDEASRW